MNTPQTQPPASLGAATGSAPVISIFATFPTEPEWERRHERCKTRKEAADCIRDARAKGGFHISVLDPWTKEREAQNKDSATDSL
ncbi:MAG: hypothetical protein NTU84_00615 [Verrucomicrobia bacterium]|nr:hypothetical protein [Verrucomicrobiota bacterium]